jgi:hypothetical protein
VVVDGEFVMLEKELQSVLKALRGAEINVVAIQNHIETKRRGQLNNATIGKRKS